MNQEEAPCDINNDTPSMLRKKEPGHDHLSRHQLSQLDAQFLQQYQLKQHIGCGGHGIVMSAIHRVSQKRVAVKFIYKTNKQVQKDMLPFEIRILKAIHHPSVVEYIDHFEDELYHYLVMELYGNEWSLKGDPNKEKQVKTSTEVSILPIPRRVSSYDLFERIESHAKLTEAQAQKIFKQIVQCVSDLSDLGIYHRDMKDENIVADADFKVKLIDFGSAIQVDRLQNKDAITEGFHGTTAFASPEVLLGLSYKPEPAEVWSLGVLLYTLLHGRSPFANRTQIIIGDWMHVSSLYERKYSNLYWNLLGGLLKSQPQKRLTIKQILLHPWMKQ